MACPAERQRDISLPHRVDRHIDVAFRFDLGRAFQSGASCKDRKDKEDAREELRTHISRELEKAAFPFSFNGERQSAGFSLVRNAFSSKGRSKA